MDYGLWLLRDADGAITLTGWSQTTSSETASTTTAKVEQWPTYILSHDRANLPERLAELGLDLAPGHMITDLDKDREVYVTHSDTNALRTRLDNQQTRNSDKG